MRRIISHTIVALLVVVCFCALPVAGNIILKNLGGGWHYQNQGDQDNIYYGIDGYGMDITLYGDTSGAYFLWDESADALKLVNSTLEVGGNILAAGLIRSNTSGISGEATVAFADSSWRVLLQSGEPEMQFKASDADASEITVNTSDQMVFQNASGGYTFDAPVRLTDILKLPLSATIQDTTGYVGGELFTFGGDTLYVYKADHTIASIP